MRDTIHTNTSLDALAITYSYRVAAYIARTDLDPANARVATAAVRACIAADAAPLTDANVRRIMTRVNDAIDVANDTRTACTTRIDPEDANDLLVFVTAYLTNHEVVAQRDRYIRRIARYARTILADDVLMSRNERRHANARRNSSTIVAAR